MVDIAVNNNNQELRCTPYCDCEFPNCIEVHALKTNIADLVHCRCGEQNCIDWTWDTQLNESIDAIIQAQNVTFHPTYSQGTAVVRGNQNLQTGMVHFWEIRLLTVLSGTDVMIGIGTDKFDLTQFKYHFASALGTNNQSWAFSYNGLIQHDGQLLPYGQKFSQGCIVGVCLDRIRGTLEFFLNRRSLGIAYKNIPTDGNIKIYPMISSTAARSAIRLINSTSRPESLQLEAFRCLANIPKSLEELRAMPGLRTLFNTYWFYAPPVKYSHRSSETEFEIADEAVLPNLRKARKQKFKDEDIDLNDIYSNAHKISALNRNDPNEDSSANNHDFFDEHFHYIF